MNLWNFADNNLKGDVTWDNSQRQFLAQHSVATLLQMVVTLFQHCNTVLHKTSSLHVLCHSFLSRYQAPGKSISPVQFGDEDWELAWEDDSAEAKQRTNDGQLKNNKKRKNKQSEDSSKVANSKDSVYEATHSNSEDHSERGPNGDLVEGHEGQLASKVLKKESGHSWKSKRTESQESKSTQKTQTPIKGSPQKKQITQESAK